MSKILSYVMLFILGTSISLMSGCNTVHGVGKDVKRGGQSIERAARG